MAREDFPTPFCPSKAILKGPSGLPSTDTVTVSSKAGLKLIGEAEGPAAPDVQSQSSWTASSRLSWCLIGRGVLPLRTVGVLDRVILSHCRRDLETRVKLKTSLSYSIIEDLQETERSSFVQHRPKCSDIYSLYVKKTPTIPKILHNNTWSAIRLVMP